MTCVPNATKCRGSSDDDTQKTLIIVLITLVTVVFLALIVDYYYNDDPTNSISEIVFVYDYKNSSSKNREHSFYNHTKQSCDPYHEKGMPICYPDKGMICVGGMIVR